MGKANVIDVIPHNLNVDGFKLICQATRYGLLEWLTREMKEYYGDNNVVATDEYLFCIGNVNMMLCSHLDTVHKRQPKQFVYNRAAETMTSPQGIGGDDRCGVFSILTILNEMDGVKPYLFFSTDEETGMNTTRKGATDLKKLCLGINYIVELDRQDTDDSVYYECGNQEFKDWINSFGFVEAQGTGSDIKVLSSEWEVASVNLSIGYKKQHTTSEKVYFNDVRKTIDRVKQIIRATQPGRFFPLQKKTQYGTYGNGTNIRVHFYIGDTVRCVESTIGTRYKTKEEASSKFALRNSGCGYITIIPNERFRVIDFDYIDLVLERIGSKDKEILVARRDRFVRV